MTQTTDTTGVEQGVLGLLQRELSDPGILARSAAETAETIATCAAALGLPGQDNSALSAKLMQATMEQIVRIQTLHGLPSNLPFQQADYMPPAWDTAKGEAAAKLGTAKASLAADLGKAQGKSGYTLTRQALKEETAPMVFPLIALSAGAVVEGFGSYIATNAAAKSAEAAASRTYVAKSRRGGKTK